MCLIHFKTIRRCAALLALACALAGCDPHATELAALKAENERLRSEIVNLKPKPGGGKEPEAVAGKADLILGINELWTQRFEDNEFRAKQRLSDKIIRVTGLLDEITGENLSIYGVGKTRNARINVSFEKTYREKIQDGLASLEKGVTLTVQGRFLYDRMELSDATIVDKVTGKPMNTEQLQAHMQAGPNGAPPPAPLPENQ